MALAVFAVGTTSPASADDLHDKQKQVKKQLKGAKGDFHDSSRAFAAAKLKLQNAEAKLAQAQDKLAKTQGDLAEAKAYAVVVQGKLQAAEAAVLVGIENVRVAKAEVVEQRRSVGQTAADNYIYGDPGLMRLSVIFNNADPNLITTQDQAIQNVMDKQNVVLAQLRDAQAKLEAEEQRLRDAQAQVEVEKKAAADNVVQTQQLTDAAASQETAVQGLVTQTAAAKSAAEAEKAADLAKLKELEAEDAKIRQMIIEQAAKNNASYNGETGGFLYRPVPGGITSPFGWRVHPIYHYYGLHDGNDYSAPCGTPMAAAGTGKIVSEYYSSVWGNRLFLNLGSVNGKNVTVIYNHISKYAASTGSTVQRGQTVAYSGTTGWSTGCHLHFTVMVDGNPVNPSSYM